MHGHPCPGSYIISNTINQRRHGHPMSLYNDGDPVYSTGVSQNYGRFGSQVVNQSGK